MKRLFLLIAILLFAQTCFAGFVAIDGPPDTTDPSIAFDQSGAPFVLSTTPETLTGTASDDVLVSSVDCTYNGGASSQATDTGTDWSTWSWSVTPLDDATSHDVVCTATDSSNNTALATLGVSYTSGGSCSTQADGSGYTGSTATYLLAAAGTVLPTLISVADAEPVYGVALSSYATGSGTYDVKAIVYDSSNNIIAITQPVTVNLSDVIQNSVAVFSSTLNLTAGNYYATPVHNHTSDVRFYQTGDTGTVYRDRNGTYDTPSDPFVSDNTYTNPLRIYFRECQ